MFILFVLLSLSVSWAQSTSVNWSCPQNGRNRNLEVPDSATLRLSDSGNGVEGFSLFQKDIVMSDTTVNYSECISRFLRDANTAFDALRATCPATLPRPVYCSVSMEKFEADLFNQFNGTWTVNMNRAQMRFLRPSLEPAAENLRQQIAGGTAPDLTKFSEPYAFNGTSRPLADFAPVARDELLRRFDALSPESAKNLFLDSFAYNNADSLRSVEDIRRSCTNGQDCLNKLHIREEVLYTARRMLERIERPADVQRRLNGICSAPGAETPRNISDLLDSLRRSSCERNENGEYPMEVGQFRMVEKKSFGADYLLRRTAEGYEGVINVNFNYTDGSVSGAEMRRRAQACLAISNQHMKGPDGTPFRIRMIDDAESDQLPRGQRPGPVNINLQRINWRSHAGTYSSKVDCDTITHEFLHLFRLVDEYHEGTLEAGACRVEVKSTSIMAQSHEAYDETIPRALTCTCDQTCQNIMNGTDDFKKSLLTTESFVEAANYEFFRDGCTTVSTNFRNIQGKRRVNAAANPDGSIQVTELGITVNGYLWEKVMSCRCPAGNDACDRGRERLMRSVLEPARPTRSCPGSSDNLVRSDYVPTAPATGLQNGNLVIGTSPRYNNLLHPNHFQKIIAGGCTDNLRGNERPIYDQCAEFAYLERSDSRCTGDGPAKSTRERCSQPGYYTGAVNPQ